MGIFNIECVAQYYQNTRERLLFFITIGVIFAGIGMMGNSQVMGIKLMGLFVAICGIAGNCLIKIWVHIKISNAKILWEMNKHFGANIQKELNRSHAQDL